MEVIDFKGFNTNIEKELTLNIDSLLNENNNLIHLNPEVIVL